MSDEDRSVDPWALEEPEPSGLISLWPFDEPPTLVEIVAAVEGAIGGPLEQTEAEPLEAEGIVWSVFLEGAQNVAVWVEAARPGGATELNDPRADAAKWVVGFETMLDPDDPLSAYIAFVRLAAESLPDGLAVLDLNSMAWYRRRELEELFLSDEIEPPAEILWTVHAIQSGTTDRVWLHTHGMWRCGQPELEMLDVPKERMGSATGLLNDVASLILEHPAAPPGEAFEIGSGLEITFQPWETAAVGVEQGQPGSIADRERTGMDAHVGHRAVICGPEPRGSFRSVWTWPEDVVDRIEGDTAVVYRTQRTTARQSALARSTLDQLATAFASSHVLRHADDDRTDGRRRIVFLLKAGFPQRAPSDGSRREHLWFEVTGVDAESVDGILINQPLEVDGLTKGEATRIPRDQVSDWSVITPVGSFGPSSIAAVWRAVDALKSEYERAEANGDG